MKARTRVKIEMGRRALRFCQDHPDPSAGYATNVRRLEECLIEAVEMIQQQSAGLKAQHGIAERKEELCWTMRRAHLAHLKRVAHGARREEPDLAVHFELWRGRIPYLEFLSRARSMAELARRHQDLLERHGMSLTLLENLEKSVEEFAELMDGSNQARMAHVGATSRLDFLGNEVVRIVGIIDALNRYRFQSDLPRLTEWTSVSNVIAPSREGEEIPPAA